MPDHDHRGVPPPAGKPDADDASLEGSRLTPPRPVDREPAEPALVEEGRRPTPVRATMEGGDEEEQNGLNDTRLVHDEESGLDWIVTVSGRSASGVLPLRTVPLMELSFAKADDPECPLRRVLSCGGDLVDISSHELLSCFRDSEPIREPLQEPNGTIQKGKRRKNHRTPRN
jgi:hypothetical protein